MRFEFESEAFHCQNVFENVLCKLPAILLKPQSVKHYLIKPLIAWFMGPPWGPSGADRTQVVRMLAPWTLLSGTFLCRLPCNVVYADGTHSTVAWWRPINPTKLDATGVGSLCEGFRKKMICLKVVFCFRHFTAFHYHHHTRLLLGIDHM